MPLLRSVTALVRKNGLISVLCVNKKSAAMRTGLQGNWREAVATLETGTQRDSRYLPSRELRRAEVIDILEAAGAGHEPGTASGYSPIISPTKSSLTIRKRTTAPSILPAARILTGKSRAVFTSSPKGRRDSS